MRNRIRELNDAFRRNPQRLGRLMLTRGMVEKPSDFIQKALKAVQGFAAFDQSNDPHGEHDFVQVNVDGQVVFGKIDYYDRSMEAGSPDPGDAEVTLRVLTVMLAEDY